jgi:regulator of protease activity HflC (stomatin/prohibitin superfamily)
MRKTIKLVLMIMSAALLLGGCHSIEPDAGEEAVLIYKPWIFGHGGVDKQPISTGLTWVAWTTSAEVYNIKPVQFDEQFNDMITRDNNPVDFNSYVEIKIIQGSTPELHEKWGKDWYRNKIQEKFRTLNRDYCRSKTMFELTTGGVEITTDMQNTLLSMISEYVDQISSKDGFKSPPLEINRVTVGKISPPKDVIEETIKTAAQKQRIKTEQSRAEAELSRKQAEQNKALADMAYRNQMSMSNPEYLKLRSIEIQKELVEVAKNHQNVSVIINMNEGSGVQPMYSVPTR